MNRFYRLGGRFQRSARKAKEKKAEAAWSPTEHSEEPAFRSRLRKPQILRHAQDDDCFSENSSPQKQYCLKRL